MRNTIPLARRQYSREAGFTLVELLVAALIFGVISAAAFGLMAQHQPLFNQQQSEAALNIAMRNAVAQMQVDIVNGGAGYYSTVNIPNWPVGVAISNNVVTSAEDCHTGTTYGANCFDSFTVITSDPNTLPVNPSSTSSASLPTSGTCSTTTVNTNAGGAGSGSLYLLPPAGVTATTYKGNFNSGDLILLVKGDGSKYTVVQLNGTIATGSYGTPAKSYVVLPFNATGTAVGLGANTASNDPTGMSVNSSDYTTNLFCDTDWVIRLTPIKYDVDITTDPTNPTLRRTVLVQGQTPAANGVPLVNQVIGFKVGASLIGSSSTLPYDFDASTFTSTTSPGGYDFTLVRSVMVSLVGRTTPATDPTYVFRNSFDGGPYQIQGVSVVINPRNMSMSD